MAKSLGVAPVDLNDDGWMDLIVANDTVQNFVFTNRHDGTFCEVGAISGLASTPRDHPRRGWASTPLASRTTTRSGFHRQLRQ